MSITCPCSKLYLDNPLCVKLTDHIDCLDGDDITDATVNLTVLDRDGVEVNGQAWPVIMTYDVDNKTYEAATNVLELTDGEIYTVKVESIDAGLSVLATWQIDLPAAKRRSS